MNSEFIIAINKTHQYVEFGDRKCGAPTARMKWLQGFQVLSLISVTANGAAP